MKDFVTRRVFGKAVAGSLLAMIGVSLGLRGVEAGHCGGMHCRQYFVACGSHGGGCWKHKCCVPFTTSCTALVNGTC